jgi:uncharacterized protein
MDGTFNKLAPLTMRAAPLAVRNPTTLEEAAMASTNQRNEQGGNPGKPKGTAKRGFAAMDEATQRSIASKGGQAAHQKGTAHEFDSEEARRAGQKGGEAVSRNREHMAAIGRKGGESRQSAARAAAAEKNAGARVTGGSSTAGSEQASGGGNRQSSKDN